MKKTFIRHLFLGFLIGVFLLGAKSASSNGTLTHEYLTPAYLVDKIYLSMRGPDHSDKNVFLLKDVFPERLWITGYEALMVGEDSQTEKTQQFMRHNTLSIHRPLDQHRALFKAPAYGTRRLFTLSQGQYELELPKGFGIPVVSSEALMLQSQVLNLNEDAIGETVRHKVKTHFVQDSDTKDEIKPLCMIPSGIAVRAGDPAAAGMPDDSELGCAVPVGDSPTGKNHRVKT